MRQKSKIVDVLIGTRPNFIKITQFKKEAEHYHDIEIRIIHTGQHYDAAMADVFFKQFSLNPDHFLQIGQCSQNAQISNILAGLEELYNGIGNPDLLLVPGDVNSTLAGAIAANKMGIKLAHLESGLRSYDRSMPEEINRIITDEISDLYFVTEQSGLKNLTDEKKTGKSYFVGNTMIDTLVAFEPEIDKSEIIKDLGIEKNAFILMTIHRPSNVDSKEGLIKLIELIRRLSLTYKVVFPVHPRTISKLNEFSLFEDFTNLKSLIQTKPLSYFDFQKLVKHASLILTDSGGIQEESTFRKIPCLTLRENTERPVTVQKGTNTLVSFNPSEIMKFINQIENKTYKKGEIPELWDGNSTQRILKILSQEIL